MWNTIRDFFTAKPYSPREGLGLNFIPARERKFLLLQSTLAFLSHLRKEKIANRGQSFQEIDWENFSQRREKEAGLSTAIPVEKQLWKSRPEMQAHEKTEIIECSPLPTVYYHTKGLQYNNSGLKLKKLQDTHSLWGGIIMTVQIQEKTKSKTL